MPGELCSFCTYCNATRENNKINSERKIVTINLKGPRVFLPLLHFKQTIDQINFWKMIHFSKAFTHTHTSQIQTHTHSLKAVRNGALTASSSKGLMKYVSLNNLILQHLATVNTPPLIESW